MLNQDLLRALRTLAEAKVLHEKIQEKHPELANITIWDVKIAELVCDYINEGMSYNDAKTRALNVVNT